MGKFNLNQILNDASRQAAPGVERSAERGAKRGEKSRQAEIQRISVYDLVPSEDNFYSMNGIEELKSKIELAGKVLQNFVVVPLDGGKYKVISGHRRRLASIALAEEGKPEYEFVPCIVEDNEKDAEIQAVREEIMLIAANSQREKTAWDKIEEARRTRALFEKIKRQEKLPGNIRNLVAQALHTSAAQVGRFDAIVRNLQPVWMEELKAERLNLSAAYELSGLSAEEQQAAFAEYRKTGEISVKAARERKQDAEPALEPVQPEKRAAVVSPVRQSLQAAVEPLEDVQGGTLPAAPEISPEAFVKPQETGRTQDSPVWDDEMKKQLNDLWQFCAEMDEAGDRSRDWGKDAGAVLFVLRLVEELIQDD